MDTQKQDDQDQGDAVSSDTSMPDWNVKGDHDREQRDEDEQQQEQQQDG